MNLSIQASVQTCTCIESCYVLLQEHTAVAGAIRTSTQPPTPIKWHSSVPDYKLPSSSQQGEEGVLSQAATIAKQTSAPPKAATTLPDDGSSKSYQQLGLNGQAYNGWF